MSRNDWRTVSVDDVGFETRELRSTLFPVLRSEHLAGVTDSDDWARQMVEETRTALSVVLPFSDAEREFLDRVLDHGQLEPSRLTDDADLADRILHHPALLWKVQNIREFKGR